MTRCTLAGSGGPYGRPQISPGPDALCEDVGRRTSEGKGGRTYNTVRGCRSLTSEGNWGGAPRNPGCGLHFRCAYVLSLADLDMCLSKACPRQACRTSSGKQRGSGSVTDRQYCSYCYACCCYCYFYLPKQEPFGVLSSGKNGVTRLARLVSRGWVRGLPWSPIMRACHAVWVGGARWG